MGFFSILLFVICSTINFLLGDLRYVRREASPVVAFALDYASMVVASILSSISSRSHARPFSLIIHMKSWGLMYCDFFESAILIKFLTLRKQSAKILARCGFLY